LSLTVTKEPLWMTLANALGKGKSSIYYYFKNKEEIFQAVLEQEVILLKSKLEKQ